MIETGMENSDIRQDEPEYPGEERQGDTRSDKSRSQRLIEIVNELFLIEVLAGFFLTGVVGLLLTAAWSAIFGVVLEFPAYQIIGSVILLIWSGRKKISLREWLHIEKPRILPLVLALLAGPACYIVSIEIATVVLMIFDVKDGGGTSPFTASLASALLNASAAGVFEEILFRGVMFPVYRQKSVTWGIFLSSVLFGMLHFNVMQGSYAVFVGIFLCLLYLTTDNLVYPVVTHFFIDMQPFLWLLGRKLLSGIFPGLQETSESLAEDAVIWLLPAIISMLFLLLLLMFLKKWKAEQEVLHEPAIRAGHCQTLSDRDLKVKDTNLIAGMSVCIFLIGIDLLTLFHSRF